MLTTGEKEEEQEQSGPRAARAFVVPKVAAGAAANVACDGPEGAGQDDRHSHARLLLVAVAEYPRRAR
ncbi:hypothetical protein D3C81_2023670 [compost metagenome]